LVELEGGRVATREFEAAVMVRATVDANRVFMAPMTRGRVTLDGVPNELMVECHRHRAGVGLIISEEIQPSLIDLGDFATPGLHDTGRVMG